MKSSLIVIALCAAACAQVIPSDEASTSADQKRRFLEVICPGNAWCSVCPAETSFAGNAGWKQRAIMFGHFLATDSDDALVSAFGCEPHAYLFTGSYLLTRNGPTWRKVWYTPGQIIDDCKKLTAADGRDRLVCWADDMHQGVSGSFLYLIDPGQDPSKRDDYTLDGFFGVQDSLGGCVKMPDGTTIAGHIDSVSFSPATAPHNVRIIVMARLGKAVIPDRILDACVENPPIVATVARKYQFTFDGQKIVPDPGNPSTDPPTTSYRPPESK